MITYQKVCSSQDKYVNLQNVDIICLSTTSHEVTVQKKKSLGEGAGLQELQCITKIVLGSSCHCLAADVSELERWLSAINPRKNGAYYILTHSIFISHPLCSSNTFCAVDQLLHIVM